MLSDLAEVSDGVVLTVPGCSHMHNCSLPGDRRGREHPRAALMDDAGAVLSCATTTTNALSFLHCIPLLPPRQRLVVHTPHILGNTRAPLPSANTQSFVLCKQVGPKAAENHSISQQNFYNHNQRACCHQFTGRCSERGSYPPAQLTSPAGPRGFALVPRI